MTPAEHYDTAEAYLEQADKASDPLHAYRLVTRAQVHATLATVRDAVDQDEPVDEAYVATGIDAEVLEGAIESLEALDTWTRSATAVPDLDHSEAEAYVNGVESAKGIVAGLVRPTLEAATQ